MDLCWALVARRLKLFQASFVQKEKRHIVNLNKSSTRGGLGKGRSEMAGTNRCEPGANPLCAHSSERDEVARRLCRATTLPRRTGWRPGQRGKAAPVAHTVSRVCRGRMLPSGARGDGVRTPFALCDAVPAMLLHFGLCSRAGAAREAAAAAPPAVASSGTIDALAAGSRVRVKAPTRPPPSPVPPSRNATLQVPAPLHSGARATALTPPQRSRLGPPVWAAWFAAAL